MKIWLNELLRSIFGEFIYNTVTSKIDYQLKLSKYYECDSEQKGLTAYIVYMADGRTTHGGLADRLKGMMSLYYYCKNIGIEFKAYFISPFLLSEYLMPNKYDWTVDERELVYDKRSAKAIIVKNNRNDNLRYLKSRLGKDVGLKQLHVYTNIDIKGIDYQKVFNELFKMSEPLRKVVDYNKVKIGGNYVSITFRFQQLLGDFKEGNYKTLDGVERDLLIERCLSFIEEIKRKHANENSILITSDSNTFLNKVQSKYDFVYVIPGQVFHIDYTNNVEKLAYLKSFVDLFMLAGANTLYSYASGPMYKESGFAALAAAIGGKPFVRINR